MSGQLRASLLARDVESGGSHSVNGGFQQQLGRMNSSLSSSSVRMEFQSIDNEVPCTLTFDNICYAVSATDKGGKKQVLRLLNNVSGYVKPGEMLAVMGPTGSGKTTLLDCLAGRKDEKNMGGTIRVNGVRRDKYVQRVTAYVLQDDVLMRVLTVRETLLFSARLRLPNTFSKLQKESMVDRIITTLGLKRCQDTKIGDQTLRGISGGERRRVNIAVELLSNPSIVFLDEITTGLDGSNALSVMQSLDKLARNSNLTMVMTIHQPRADIMDLFSRLLLLAEGGHVAYFGCASGAVPYLQVMGYRGGSFESPSDFILDILTSKGNRSITCDEEVAYGERPVEQQELTAGVTSRRINFLLHEYRNSNLKAESEQELAELSVTHDRVTDTFHPAISQEKRRQGQFATGILWQIWVLMWRGFLYMLREPSVVWSRLITGVVMGIIQGLVFLQIPANPSNVHDRSSALFFFVTYLGLCTFPALPRLFDERPMFQRENAASFYHSFSYFVAGTLLDIPVGIMVALVYTSILYFMVGFVLEADHFFFFVLVAILAIQAGFAYCQLTASVFSNHEAGMAILSLIHACFLLFSKFFITNVPSYFLWLQAISLYKFGFEAVAVEEYSGRYFPGEPPITGDQVLRDRDISSDAGFRGCLFLFVTYIVVKTLNYFALALLHKEKR